MTIRKKPTLLTSFILIMPLFGLLFNNWVHDNKSKVYTEKDASHDIKHVSKYQFGQSRWKNDHQNVIQNHDDLDEWLDYDWSNYSLKTVVIDPGHGGKDEGTIAPDGTQEKDIALSIGKQLGDFIKASHPTVKVIYTRTTDAFIPLKKRAEIANSNKADLFISIHCNSFRKSSVRGTETYVMGLHRAEENMEVIKRENDVVLLEEDYESSYEEYGVDRESPLYEILMNSYQNAFLDQSLSFAQILDKKLTTKGHSTRGVHQAGFLVLRRTAMPSVLVETGYLSNASDRAVLTSKEGQKNLATELYYAFTEYKRNVEAQRTGKVSQEPIEVETTTVPEVVETPIKEKDTGIQFGIQLASSTKELTLKEDKWGLVKERLVIQKSNGGLIRYVLKDYGTDYEKAKSEKKTLRESGFTGCFIIAYKNEQRIELYKAKKELGL